MDGTCYRLMPRKIECDQCAGIGKLKTTSSQGELRVCETCNGTGRIKTDVVDRVAGAHKGSWVWKDGAMTGEVECIVCGERRMTDSSHS